MKNSPVQMLIPLLHIFQYIIRLPQFIQEQFILCPEQPVLLPKQRFHRRIKKMQERKKSNETNEQAQTQIPQDNRHTLLCRRINPFILKRPWIIPVIRFP
jgi:hypothetical protein